ncbi:MAG: leucyl aminopeptidase [Pseudomonadota bacterium]
MDIKFATSATADIAAFVLDEGAGLTDAAAALDANAGGIVAQAASQGRFSGKTGQSVATVLPAGADAKVAVLFGGGKAEDRKPVAYELIAAALIKSQAKSGHETAAFYAASAEEAAKAAEGAKLAAYRFDTYFTKLKDDQKPSLKTLTIVTDDVAAAEAAFELASAGTDGTYLARDLVNEPPSHLYPQTYADRLVEMESEGLKVTILGEDELKALGMGSMLGVGQGSTKESKLGILEWTGGSDEAPVALVGKGVCFDTGGISLKPGPAMEEMRGDMGGSAAVVGTMLALARRKAKANVVGLVGLVENMPDGDAIKPGDILHSASGQTIEVQNTDAEGRLVLADVLWYAQEHYKPEVIVDLATLTGAIVIALGHEHAGMFTDNDELAKSLKKAGRASGESVWRMPLGDAYDKLLKSQFADMRNIGGRPAGSVTAAQFLKRFVNEGQKWVHLDIAGVAWRNGEKPPTDPAWASGYGPRLLNQWIKDNYEG